MAIRILLVDDHAVLREGLRALLSVEPDLEIVAEAADGQEAIRLAEELHPHIVLMDISMPGLDGIETTRQLVKKSAGIRVLILTVHEDESLLREAIRAGISGYILKRANKSEVVNAIHTVWKGETYIHPKMARTLFKSLSPSPATKETAIDLLTPREIEVLIFIVRGYTNRQIAKTMNLSIRTVEGHRLNMMNRLGMRTRLELVNFAEEHGFFR